MIELEWRAAVASWCRRGEAEGFPPVVRDVGNCRNISTRILVYNGHEECEALFPHSVIRKVLTEFSPIFEDEEPVGEVIELASLPEFAIEEARRKAASREMLTTQEVIDCTRCGGNGTILGILQTEVCPRCNGSGKQIKTTYPSLDEL